MMRASKCSCGGTLRSTTIDEVDLLPLFGLRGVFKGAVKGLRCSTCAEVTFEAKIIEEMFVALTFAVLSQPRILTNEEARFVRKVVLRLTQASLAKRMGINIITIADWERGERPLSKEHDYELRGIALSQLIKHHARQWKKTDALTRDISSILTSPRMTAPPKRLKRYVVQSMMPAA